MKPYFDPFPLDAVARRALRRSARATRVVPVAYGRAAAPGELVELDSGHMPADGVPRRAGGPADGMRRMVFTTPVRDALDSAVIGLTAARLDTPRLDAEVLLAHVARRGPHGAVPRTPGAGSTATEAGAFRDLVARRREHEPVAHLTGRRASATSTSPSTPRVLVPRPETEHLVEAALDLPAGARVVDVGTGSGAVALALKHERPDLTVVGTDVSADALDVARANARAARARRGLRRGRPAGRRARPTPSSPTRPTWPTATRCRADVRDYEPALALFAGPDGLDVYRRLAPAACASGAALRGLRGRRRARPPRSGSCCTRAGARRGGRDAGPGRDRPAWWSPGADRSSRPASRAAASPCSRPTRSTGSPATRRTRPRSSASTRSRAARPDKPAAVMFFDAARALAAPDWLGPRTRAALERLLPGGVTLLLPEPGARVPARLRAADRSDTLGLRVPAGAPLAGGARGRSCSPRPTSPAGPTRAGSPTSRPTSRRGRTSSLDAGELPGVASTVIDLRSLRGRRVVGRAARGRRVPRRRRRGSLGPAPSCAAQSRSPAARRRGRAGRRRARIGAVRLTRTSGQVDGLAVAGTRGRARQLRPRRAVRAHALVRRPAGPCAIGGAGGGEFPMLASAPRDRVYAAWDAPVSGGVR